MKEQPRIIKASESGQKLKPIPDDKVCIHCGVEISYANITPRRVETYNWVCDICFAEKMKALNGQYRYSMENEEYKIDRAKSNAAPRIIPKEINEEKSNYELLIDVINNTERFRLDSMFRIMFNRKADPKDRKVAINYLLKSFEKLDHRQCVQVVNCVHELIGGKRTPNDIKVKLATEIRSFTGEGKVSKEQGVKSYEDTLRDGGEIDIDA
jgi:hypothetical protein